MIRPRMRPEFELALAADGEVLLDRIRTRLSAPDAPLIGQVIPGHAILKIPRERRSLLSPMLHVEVVVRDRRQMARGRFTPHPNVWTGFMAVYGLLAMLGLAGLMYGFAQLTVDETPWAMLAAPAAIALIAFVYGATLIGQGLTADEMHELRGFVESVASDGSV
jgi:hypothetical protein